MTREEAKLDIDIYYITTISTSTSAKEKVIRTKMANKVIDEVFDYF